MKAFIEHESRGRLRVRMKQYRMTLEQADLLEAYLQNQPGVLSATVHERTCCAVIRYIGDRENIIRAIAQFNYTAPSVTALTPTHSGRALNREYQEKLVGKVITKFACTLFLPAPLQIARTIWLSLPFLGRGLKRLIHRELKVELLDALSIGVSMVRRDFSTAGSVMFLLDIGELLEEWTHKKSVDDLARCMSLNVKRVWLKTDDAEVLVPLSNITVGDRILVRMGNVIPLDGEVVEGEVMVNQASLTGESMPVAKRPGTQVYAGTVIEEGDCVIEVTQSSGESRYDKIVSMIEQSEQLKSAAESHAANLADKLVPYTLIGSALSYALTRNVTRALSVLMVDFSCALKLAMPLAVLSAMREASMYHITVKGGKFLEAVAQADTIVFDKTGTLTKGEFKVTEMKPAGVSKDKLLEVAALGESYSNHPIAGSIIEAYGKEIERSRVSDAVEIAGHGVQILVDGVMTYVGNEKLMKKQSIAYEPCESAGTIVYVGQEQTFLGALVISDTVKEGAAEAIHKMKNVGVKKCVMLTGDREKTAKHVADELKLDEVHAELLPGDKVDEVEKLLSAQKDGERLAFVGDGINDAPVLTRADIGIAMGSLGSDAAIEAADVVLMDDDIRKIASTVLISRKTLRIVKQNIVFALAVKAVVLLLGAIGVANMWEAVFADVGVSVLAILNSMRVMKNH